MSNEEDSDYYDSQIYTTKIVLNSNLNLKEILLDTDVLLDNQANLHVFKDKHLLTNIRKASREVSYDGSTGEPVLLTHQGDYKDIKNIWWDPNGKVNILSYYKIKKSLETNEAGSIVESNDGWNLSIRGEFYHFKRKLNGLHACDFANHMPNKYGMLSTVESNKLNFRKRDIKRANEAMELMRKMNFTSAGKLKRMLNGGRIQGCKLTGRDVSNAIKLYGDNLASLKGKTRNKKVKEIRNDV